MKKQTMSAGIYAIFVATLLCLNNYYPETALPWALSIALVSKLGLEMLTKQKQFSFWQEESFQTRLPVQLETTPSATVEQQIVVETQQTSLAWQMIEPEIIRSAGFIAASTIELIYTKKLYNKFPLLTVGTHGKFHDLKCNHDTCRHSMATARPMNVRGIYVMRNGGFREQSVILTNEFTLYFCHTTIETFGKNSCGILEQRPYWDMRTTSMDLWVTHATDIRRALENLEGKPDVID